MRTVERTRFNPELSGKFSQGHGVAFPLHHDVPPTIVLLSFGVCPSAITRFVIAIVVNPIKAQPFRRFPHIFKKTTEVTRPPITHSDATPTIIGIARMICIITTTFRSSPGRIFFGMLTNSMTVFSCTGSSYFLMQAATTFRSTSLQTSSVRIYMLTTLTFTNPRTLTTASSRSSNDCQASEDLSFQFQGNRHGSSIQNHVLIAR